MHPLADASRAPGRIPTSAQHADSSTAAAHRGAGWHTSRTAIDTAHEHASRLHGSSHDCNTCNEPATSPSCSTQSPTNCIACLRPPVQAAPRPQLTHAHNRQTDRETALSTRHQQEPSASTPPSRANTSPKRSSISQQQPSWHPKPFPPATLRI